MGELIGLLSSLWEGLGLYSVVFIQTRMNELWQEDVLWPVSCECDVNKSRLPYTKLYGNRV